CCARTNRPKRIFLPPKSGTTKGAAVRTSGDHLRRARIRAQPCTHGKFVLSAVTERRERRSQDKRGRTDRPLRVVPRIDLDGHLAKRRKEVGAKRVLERLGVVRPGLAAFSADENQLRAQDVDEPRHRLTEDARRLGVDLYRAPITRVCLPAKCSDALALADHARGSCL